jgi:4'-phosphopantetheinyl transferase EntD
MITPGDGKSSELVGGFPTEFRVARVPVAAAESYRSCLRESEWIAANAFEGQRLIEHVAGRVAARIALAALIGPAADDALIERADDGSPRVSGIFDPPLVSISHGRRAAVAVVGHARELGIDLCDHDDAMRVRRVVVRFVRPDETALAERGGVPRWAALWALKEAGAKALHHGLLEGGLRATSLRSIAPPVFDYPALAAQVSYGTDHVIALAYRL